jgi:hypothetical protein
MARIPSIPTEAQGFLRDHKQVIFPSGYGRWMTPKALEKAVRSHKADHWNVVDTNLDTGEIQIICCYCATGIENPNAADSSVKLPSSTLH